MMPIRSLACGSDEIHFMTLVINAQQLYDARDKSVHCVVRHVVNIYTDPQWFYEACNKCYSKVYPIEAGFECQRCKSRQPDCVTRWVSSCVIMYAFFIVK